MLIQQEQTITMLAWDHTMMGNPVPQLARNGLCLSIGISFLLGQDMPNRDQQFARDGDNRLLFADPPAQALNGDGAPPRPRQLRPSHPANRVDPLWSYARPDEFPPSHARLLLARHSRRASWQTRSA
jgi:hypothetical protein